MRFIIRRESNTPGQALLPAPEGMSSKCVVPSHPHQHGWLETSQAGTLLGLPRWSDHGGSSIRLWSEWCWRGHGIHLSGSLPWRCAAQTIGQRGRAARSLWWWLGANLGSLCPTLQRFSPSHLLSNSCCALSRAWWLSSCRDRARHSCRGYHNNELKFNVVRLCSPSS